MKKYSIESDSTEVIISLGTCIDVANMVPVQARVHI